jgi:SPP1 family predicted phage head-tail adaptor
MPGPNDVPLGGLRERVTIQRAAYARGANGEPLQSWEDVEEVWARVEPLTSRELYLAAQAQVLASHRVTLRHRADVRATTHRLAWNGRTLNLTGVRDPEARGRWLELLCLEKGA